MILTNKTHIFLENEDRLAIQDQFNISRQTMFNVLSYRFDNRMHNRIRKAIFAQFGDRAVVIEEYRRPMAEIDCYTQKFTHSKTENI